jgi:prepilin-type N-terminal cleavage/methylation domain-containing protein
MVTRRGDAREDGFTLIELMVVVLIIAILLAIAVPTFLGARERANDRAAQTDLRNAHTNHLVWFADNKPTAFTSDPSELLALDSSLDWTDQFADLEGREGSLYVLVTTVVGPSGTPHDAVIVGKKARPGTCFWLRAVAGEDHPRFGKNDCQAVPAVFERSWG